MQKSTIFNRLSFFLLAFICLFVSCSTFFFIPWYFLSFLLKFVWNFICSLAGSFVFILSSIAVYTLLHFGLLFAMLMFSFDDSPLFVLFFSFHWLSYPVFSYLNSFIHSHLHTFIYSHANIHLKCFRLFIPISFRRSFHLNFPSIHTFIYSSFNDSFIPL